MICAPTVVINYQTRSVFIKLGKMAKQAVDLKHKDLNYNARHDLSVNNDDTEVLCLEIISQKLKHFY